MSQLSGRLPSALNVSAVASMEGKVLSTSLRIIINSLHFALETAQVKKAFCPLAEAPANQLARQLAS